MAIEVKIPQISDGVDSAQVIEVLVSEGDSITEEQSIIAVETDKASVEVPSSHSGRVKEIKVKEGDEVKVGDVILILEEEGKEGEEEEDDKDQKTEEKEESEEKEKKNQENKKKEEEGEDKNDDDKKVEESKSKEEKTAKKEEKETEKKVDIDKEGEDKDEDEKEKGKEKDLKEIPASPGIRRLAREIGVDIKNISGSGPGGRITEEDVKSQSKDNHDKDKMPKQASLPDFSKWGLVEKEPLSNIRKITAKNTAASWQTVPHVFQFDEADISGIDKYMEKNKNKAEEAGGKLTITAILTKVMASALQQFPMFNASIDMGNEEVILKKYFHIGIAVDTEKGLLVPVIRDVDKKTIIELAVEITELAEKTRQGKLAPEEMQGGNISISNLGGIGGTNFTPIVYPPQVAILGVSRAKQQPVFVNGVFESRQILPMSLSYDHRLIDGADGAKFLRWICQALEDPYKALLGA